MGSNDEICGGIQARVRDDRGWGGRVAHRTLVLEVGAIDPKRIEEIGSALQNANLVIRVSDDGHVTATIDGGRIEVRRPPPPPPSPPPPPDMGKYDHEADLLGYCLGGRTRSLQHMGNVRSSVRGLRPEHFRDPRARVAFRSMLRHPTPSSGGAASEVIACFLAADTHAEVEIGRWLASLPMRIDTMEALEIARRLVEAPPDDELPEAA